MTRPQRTVRVLLLDSSAARRQRLQRLLDDAPHLQVAGMAANADQALQLAQEGRADVVLLGQATGASHALAWTRKIMETRPLPVVVVSAVAASANDPPAIELMQAGAVAVVPDPAGKPAAAAADAARSLQQTLRLMSEVKLVRRWSRRNGEASAVALPAAVPEIERLPRRRIEVVAIGASTGGPVALKDILCALPADFPVPILIVQHMASGFLQGLVEWLSAQCAIRCEVAAAGATALPGRAYLAPDGLHLRLGPRRSLLLDEGPPVNGHRPAASCLFESVAQQCGRHAVGVVLTGMGKDGAAELKMMRDAGAITIAQDRETSAVHGMPGEAIRSGAACHVMAPLQIAATLRALVTPKEAA